MTAKILNITQTNCSSYQSNNSQTNNFQQSVIPQTPDPSPNPSLHYPSEIISPVQALSAVQASNWNSSRACLFLPPFPGSPGPRTFFQPFVYNAGLACGAQRRRPFYFPLWRAYRWPVSSVNSLDFARALWCDAESRGGGSLKSYEFYADSVVLTSC